MWGKQSSSCFFTAEILTTCPHKLKCWLWRIYFTYQILFAHVIIFLKLINQIISIFIAVQLIYNVSSIKQSDSVIQTYTYIHIYIFSFRFLSIIDYYMILNIVSCAIQSVLVYLVYIQQCVSVHPKLLIYPRHSSLATMFFSMSVSLFLFHK